MQRNRKRAPVVAARRKARRPGRDRRGGRSGPRPGAKRRTCAENGRRRGGGRKKGRGRSDNAGAGRAPEPVPEAGGGPVPGGAAAGAAAAGAGAGSAAGAGAGSSQGASAAAAAGAGYRLPGGVGSATGAGRCGRGTAPRPGPGRRASGQACRRRRPQDPLRESGRAGCPRGRGLRRRRPGPAAAAAGPGWCRPESAGGSSVYGRLGRGRVGADLVLAGARDAVTVGIGKGRRSRPSLVSVGVPRLRAKLGSRSRCGMPSPSESALASLMPSPSVSPSLGDVRSRYSSGLRMPSPSAVGVPVVGQRVEAVVGLPRVGHLVAVGVGQVRRIDEPVAADALRRCRRPARLSPWRVTTRGRAPSVRASSPCWFRCRRGSPPAK